MIAAVLAAAAVATPSLPRHAQRVTRERTVATGTRIGTLTVPRLQISEPILEGTNAAQLARGVGHYVGTDMPGGSGTVGIAGHRVTHTRAFLHINLLHRGDLIVLSVGRRSYTYRVFTMRIVKPSAVWVLGGTEDRRLVLTTCHPPGTALRRLVVFAREVASRTPAG